MKSKFDRNHKVLALTACLLACCLILSGCAVLPALGLRSMFRDSMADSAQREAQLQQTDVSGDTVTISREEYEQYQKYDTLLQILAIVEENYYEETDEEKLLDGAAAGMLDAIGDPYTFYYDAEAFASMWEDDEGEYAGVGILISANYQTNVCTAIRIFTGSPAEKAGVLRGDILYKVEDMYVTAENLQDAVDIMRGTPGTDVHVTFLRNGEVKTPSGSGSYTGDPTATSGTLTLTSDGQTMTVTINGDNLEVNGSVIATRA